jgi:hypothetical protein
MKRIVILIICVCSWLSVTGQIYINDLLYFPEAPEITGEYCMQTIYNKIDNSSIYLQLFLQNKLDLTGIGELEDNIKNGIGTIKFAFINKNLNFNNNKIDEEAYKIYFKYSVFTVDSILFVDKLDIWGNWENVANFFIFYYPTKINIEYLKKNKKEITSNYSTDKAIFSSEFLNGKLIGRIKVRSASTANSNEFIKLYERNKQRILMNTNK